MDRESSQPPGHAADDADETVENLARGGKRTKTPWFASSYPGRGRPRRGRQLHGRIATSSSQSIGRHGRDRDDVVPALSASTAPG